MDLSVILQVEPKAVPLAIGRMVTRVDVRKTPRRYKGQYNAAGGCPRGKATGGDRTPNPPRQISPAGKAAHHNNARTSTHTNIHSQTHNLYIFTY